LRNLTLFHIEELLQTNRRSLKQFPTMPYLDGYVVAHYGNRLIYFELDYNVVNEQNVLQKSYNSMLGKKFLAKFVIKVENTCIDSLFMST